MGGRTPFSEPITKWVSVWFSTARKKGLAVTGKALEIQGTGSESVGLVGRRLRLVSRGGRKRPFPSWWGLGWGEGQGNLPLRYAIPSGTRIPGSFLPRVAGRAVCGARAIRAPI